MVTVDSILKQDDTFRLNDYFATPSAPQRRPTTVVELSTQRLRRFVRHRFRKPSFVMTARDREIVRLVSDFRVISSDDLQLLLPGSRQTILRRLQKLFHHGFLDRPQSQRILGNGRMVYALGQHGAELLAQASGRSSSVDWSEKNRHLRTRYLEHALMVSRFHVALSHVQACSKVILERVVPGRVRSGSRAHRTRRSDRTDCRVERQPDRARIWMVVRITRASKQSLPLNAAAR